MKLKTMVDRLVTKARLTQAEIAAKCGTSQSTISQLQTGQRERTSYEVGTAIARLYDELFPKPSKKSAT